MKPLLWLVEDEPSIADTLIYTLESEGFQVRWFERGECALLAQQKGTPALAILDVGLPGMNGFELCRQLLVKTPDLPVLFLSARCEELDRLIGLEIGADDYVAKPFSPREISARVRSILRRVQKMHRPQQPILYQYGAFKLDEEGASICYYQQLLLLTRYEFLLLKTLILSPNRVFSRQHLMDIVWTQADMSLDRTVDTHIKTLRAKLRAVNACDSPIHTYRGLGYSMSCQS